jgi:hypothetical protein
VLVVDGKRLVALRPPARPESPAERAARAVEERAVGEQATAWLALARKALRTSDTALIQRLLDAAGAGGAEGRDVDRLEADLERVRAAGTPAQPARVRAIEEEAARVTELPIEQLVAAARVTRDVPERRALLSRALARVDGHPAADALVRELLPPGTPVPRTFDAARWLEFLEAGSGAELRVVTLDEAPAGSPAARALAREAKHGRTGLAAFSSDRLLVVAEHGSPGRVARCLEIGELLCDVLEELFGAPAGDGAPLELLLYESQDEYVRESQRHGELPEAMAGWTAGHFSAASGLSRMFVPESGEAARLLGVYAHELTHHWLEVRGPGTREVRGGRDARRGYWIAEGIATAVEEFHLDPRAGTWDVRDERAGSLDTLAHARADQLLDWERLLSLTADDFAGLDPRGKHLIELTWRLGVRRETSEMRLFYEQAGALCHWLLQAEGGARRPELIAFVEAWYTGDVGALDLAKQLSLTPEAIGERVTAFARARR